VATILTIFLRINCPNFIIGFWLHEVIFKDTQFDIWRYAY